MRKKKMDLFNVLTCLCNNSPTLTFFNFYCQSKKNKQNKTRKVTLAACLNKRILYIPGSAPKYYQQNKQDKKKKKYII